MHEMYSLIYGGDSKQQTLYMYLSRILILYHRA